MYHLIANGMTIATTVDTDVPALNDDIIAIQNSHFVLSQPMQLIGAAAMGILIDRARIASPTMRQIANPYVRSLIAAAVPGSNPNMWLLDHNPFTVPAFEEIQVLGTSTTGTTEKFTAFTWLTPGMEVMPIGNVIPLRFTSTTAAVANAWTTLSITFGDTLPTGLYAMVLSEMFSTNGQAHRWIISNQTWRPGLMSFTLTSQRHPYAIAKGQWGVMGRFRSNDLPRLQVMCNGADATHVGYLHVVRIGNIY